MSEKQVKSITLRSCEIVQQRGYLQQSNIDSVVRSYTQIQEYAYILHDKDLDEVGNLKPAHWHILLKLKSPLNVNTIANRFGVPAQYIGKIKGKWQDGLKYLIHENASDKYQYAVDEVKSNFDWVSVKSLVTGRDRRCQQLVQYDDLDFGTSKLP